MSRYIDIETIKPRQYENSEVELGVLAYDFDEVEAMPFLDIVWCKECKHSGVRNDADIECKKHKLIMRLNDYCSCGERKDERSRR